MFGDNASETSDSDHEVVDNSCIARINSVSARDESLRTRSWRRKNTIDLTSGHSTTSPKRRKVSNGGATSDIVTKAQSGVETRQRDNTRTLGRSGRVKHAFDMSSDDSLNDDVPLRRLLKRRKLSAVRRADMHIGPTKPRKQRASASSSKRSRLRRMKEQSKRHKNQNTEHSKRARSRSQSRLRSESCENTIDTSDSEEDEFLATVEKAIEQDDADWDPEQDDVLRRTRSLRKRKAATVRAQSDKKRRRYHSEEDKGGHRAGRGRARRSSAEASHIRDFIHERIDDLLGMLPETRVARTPIHSALEQNNGVDKRASEQGNVLALSLLSRLLSQKTSNSTIEDAMSRTSASSQSFGTLRPGCGVSLLEIPPRTSAVDPTLSEFATPPSIGFSDFQTLTPFPALQASSTSISTTASIGPLQPSLNAPSSSQSIGMLRPSDSASQTTLSTILANVYPNITDPTTQPTLGVSNVPVSKTSTSHAASSLCPPQPHFDASPSSSSSPSPSCSATRFAAGPSSGTAVDCMMYHILKGMEQKSASTTTSPAVIPEPHKPTELLSMQISDPRIQAHRPKSPQWTSVLNHLQDPFDGERTAGEPKRKSAWCFTFVPKWLYRSRVHQCI